MKLIKIPSFTLSELLVVMAIMSILLTGVFFSLNSIQKQVNRIKLSFDSELEIFLLERRLISDFSYQQIGYDSIEKNLIFYNDKSSKKIYKILDSIIISNDDTINLRVRSVNLYETGKLNSYENIDALEMIFDGVFTSKKIFVSKRRDAAYYMNR